MAGSKLVKRHLEAIMRACVNCEAEGEDCCDPKRNPALTVRLGNPKYASWQTFLNNAYWSVDLK